MVMVVVCCGWLVLDLNILFFLLSLPFLFILFIKKKLFFFY